MRLKIITILTLLLTACGKVPPTELDRISCEQMIVLSNAGLLPASQQDRDQLRVDLAQVIADEQLLGKVSSETLLFCDY